MARQRREGSNPGWACTFPLLAIPKFGFGRNRIELSVRVQRKATIAVDLFEGIFAVFIRQFVITAASRLSFAGKG